MSVGNADVISTSIGPPPYSTENHREGKACLTGFLVLAVHILCGLRHRQDGFVKADAVAGCDFITCNRISRPCLDRAKSAALDARNLHVSGNWVAGHPKMMLKRRLRSIFDDPWVSAMSLCNHCCSHCGSDANLGLTTSLGGGQRCIMFAQIPNRGCGDHAVANLLCREFASSFTESVDERWHNSGGSSCWSSNDEMSPSVFFRSCKSICRNRSNPAIGLILLILCPLVDRGRLGLQLDRTW